MNDNPPEEAEILRFKKKQVTQEDTEDILASVFLRNGLVALDVQGKVAYLNQSSLIQLVLILLSAFKIQNDIHTK